MSGRRVGRVRQTGSCISELLDGLEFVVYAVGGLVGLVLVAIKGVNAAQDHGGLAVAGAMTVGLLAVLGLAVRDLRRRRWSVASVAVATAYAVAVLAVMGMA